jgi:hypothetical protein
LISRDINYCLQVKVDLLFPSLTCTQETCFDPVEHSSKMGNMPAFNSTQSIPYNETNTSITSSASPSQLSWQSALWALMAIALNTMTQSSPSSNSLFLDPFSLLRASPIVCLADLLVMMLWVLKLSTFSHRRLSFLEAMRCFRKETSLEKKTERISVLTVVLFVLGPLPQFIKLNACNGVPWTLTWSWIYMLCYALRAISIVCDRGENEDHHLLRAGTALNNRTKAMLKRFSQRMYILAYIVQLIFSGYLVRVSMYTYAMHKIISILFAIFTISYIAFCFSVGLVGCAIAFLNCCGVVRGVENADLPRGWRRWFVISIFASIWATNIYWLSWLWGPLSALEGYFGPFSVTSTIAISICLIFAAGICFGLLALLSTMIGSSFIISLHRFPRGRLAPHTSIPLDTQVTQTLRQAESSRKVEETKIIVLASLHFPFAVSLLLLALSYYWQVYDPSGTVKPKWVVVFG